jgi:peptide/nickel transport system substrate-binding protein
VKRSETHVLFSFLVEENNIILQKIRARRSQFYSQREKMSLAVRSFSGKEKALFCLFSFLAIVSGIGILSGISQSYMITVPAYGGSFSEGIIGTPRFINPVLATSDSSSEKALVQLIYSGLLRAGANGELEPDLARKYEISEDGHEYVFTLKNDLVWSDNYPITADDIIFTIQTIQNPSIRSPKKSSWDGVTAEKIDGKTIKFTLKQPYAPFLENLTVGILPKHIWGDLAPEEFVYSSYNNNPIGSGPFKIQEIKQNKSGIPESYALQPFEKFALGKPYLGGITIRFYPNYEKLAEGYLSKEVLAIAAPSPKNVQSLKMPGTQIKTAPLPKFFSVFLNQNQQQLFLDKTVRKALDTAIDKDAIIHDVLLGYAAKAEGPLPAGVAGFLGGDDADVKKDGYDRIEAAKNILAKDGWKLNPATGIMEKTAKKKPTATLHFSLSISEDAELKKTAETIKKAWEKIGARVDLKVYEEGDLLQTVIRPRKYDALLYGEVVGRNPDLFLYWHSSQRFDPGVNIALYANLSADKLLEKAREESDREERAALYQKFQEEVVLDTPAIFLYSPSFIYLVPENIQGVDLSGMSVVSDRFVNAYKWYARTQRVWRVFSEKQ